MKQRLRKYEPGWLGWAMVEHRPERPYRPPANKAELVLSVMCDMFAVLVFAFPFILMLGGLIGLIDMIVRFVRT